MRNTLPKYRTAHGPTWIGTGLLILLFAQLGSAIPIAAAIALIGFGSTLVLARSPHQRPLWGLNLAVYFLLVFLACGAELDLGVRMLTLLDCSLAILIFVATTRFTWLQIQRG